MLTYTEGLPFARAAGCHLKPKERGEKRGHGRRRTQAPVSHSGCRPAPLCVHAQSPHRDAQRESSPLGNKMEWVCFGFVFSSFATVSCGAQARLSGILLVSLVLALPGAPQAKHEALPPQLATVKLSCCPLQSLESRFHQAGEPENASLPPQAPSSPSPLLYFLSFFRARTKYKAAKAQLWICRSLPLSFPHSVISLYPSRSVGGRWEDGVGARSGWPETLWSCHHRCGG